jgi:Kef-type K+ transport system membrane component KefB
VAIVTKIAGSFGGALAGGFNVREATRVGYGMVSRGEVALVVAVVGLDHGLIDDKEFSATILMTLVTTLVAPLLLKWSYRERAARRDRRYAEAAPAAVMVAESAEA